MDLCQQYDNSPKFPGKYHTDQHSRSDARQQGRVRKMWVITAALLMLLINLAFSIDQSLMLRAARVMGAPAVEGLLAWQKMHNSTAALPESAKINAVNRFFNQRIRFADDFAIWGQNDYWATPLETLNKGAGDCEDYAIAKYFTLLSMGIPPDRLRLTYVRAAMTREGEVQFIPHMVLAYYPQAGKEPVVLDNLVEAIQSASARTDLRPVFSFNSEGLWEQTGSNASSVSLDRLSRWRDLLQRAGSEGFR
jgi:predicted transglutaminase-like cysteine proteinase